MPDETRPSATPATGRRRPARPGESSLPAEERILVPGLLGLALLLRLAYLFRYRFDTDEPQHLHVAWSWAQGLAPYRDVFDNHAPLFHMLTAPLAALAGETPRILFVMRIAMIPLWLAALACVWTIGRRLYGPRAGAWAAVLLALTPDFFFKSLEYRADALWMALWTLALAVLVGRPPTTRRALAAGLLAGAALATSLKTTLLLAALGGAWLALRLRPGGRRGAGDGGEAVAPAGAARRALAFLAGIAAAPAAVIAYLGARGSIGAAWQCAVGHNLMAATLAGHGHRRWLLAPALAAAWLLAGRIASRAPARGAAAGDGAYTSDGAGAGDGAGAALLPAGAGFYVAIAGSLWPLLTLQDLLPFWPMVWPALAALATREKRAGADGGAPPARRGAGRLLPAGLAAAGIALILIAVPIGEDAARRETDLLADVLRLTEPADRILDLKGETVFRRRPYYYVMEIITRRALDRHLIPDTVIDDLIATRTAVTIRDVRRFPRKVTRFVESHYLPVGRLRVAGCRLDPAEALPSGAIRFDVVIPARYALVSDRGPASGLLDGEPFDAPRMLAAGPHEVVPGPGGGRLAVIWARAAETGFTPFGPGDGPPVRAERAPGVIRFARGGGRPVPGPPVEHGPPTSQERHMKRISSLVAGGAAMVCLAGAGFIAAEKAATQPMKKAEQPEKAVAIIQSKSDSHVTGKAVFTEESGKVTLRLKIEGADPGTHAVHLHEKGDCTAADGASAGGHWNPTHENHGRWAASPFHHGDIGNVEVGSDGKGTFELATDLWTIGGPAETDVIGKAIIVHAKADDFTTQPTGNAGGRVGCGVVETKAGAKAETKK